MLPNVLLIIVNVSPPHDFYYLCNLPVQLVSVLVILILEFHMCLPSFIVGLIQSTLLRFPS